jgi:hypothetical protein
MGTVCRFIFKNFTNSVLCLGHCPEEFVMVACARWLKHNGPAIWGGCVTRRQHRAGSWYPAPAGPESCHGARRVWRTFCRHGTNFIEHYACRGTSMIGAGKLSRYRMFVRGTGAVSRYNLSRSQKSVTVQDFNCVLMRVTGCMNHYKFVLRAGAKAKSVTNNLPILSVLVLVILFFVMICSPVN